MHYANLPPELKEGIHGAVTEHEDGSISVDGAVDWAGQNLSQLPIQFKEVTEYFFCGYNQLTSLNGAPHTVGGEFRCSYNKLTSLEFAPKSVDRSFCCESNQITSLVGAPRVINNSFYCNENPLKTLKGAPDSVGKNFYCSSCNLISLEGAPKYIGGYFICDRNQLKSLDGLGAVELGIDCDDNLAPENEMILAYQRKRTRKELSSESLAVDKIVMA